MAAPPHTRDRTFLIGDYPYTALATGHSASSLVTDSAYSLVTVHAKAIALGTAIANDIAGIVNASDVVVIVNESASGIVNASDHAANGAIVHGSLLVTVSASAQMPVAIAI